MTAVVGRRERKKLRTREQLVDAAFELFEKKGFEATSIEEIADAVDVSSRTFFRYFGSKEDVVLTFQDEMMATMLQALTERPPDEPIMTAMRKTAVRLIRAGEAGTSGLDGKRFACMQLLMEDSPAVMSRSLEHTQKKHADLAALIASRMGVDPADDLRPIVVAATAMAAFNAAFDLYTRDPDRKRRFSSILNDVFAVLEGDVNFPSATPTAR